MRSSSMERRRGRPCIALRQRRVLPLLRRSQQQQPESWWFRMLSSSSNPLQTVYSPAASPPQLCGEYCARSANKCLRWHCEELSQRLALCPLALSRSSYATKCLPLAALYSAGGGRGRAGGSRDAQMWCFLAALYAARTGGRRGGEGGAQRRGGQACVSHFHKKAHAQVRLHHPTAHLNLRPCMQPLWPIVPTQKLHPIHPTPPHPPTHPSQCRCTRHHPAPSECAQPAPQRRRLQVRLACVRRRPCWRWPRQSAAAAACRQRRSGRRWQAQGWAAAPAPAAAWRRPRRRRPPAFAAWARARCPAGARIACERC